jgi:hypothetical protein
LVAISSRGHAGGSGALFIAMTTERMPEKIVASNVGGGFTFGV